MSAMEGIFAFAKSSREESEGKKQVRELQDLRKKTNVQLLELLHRQNHILSQKGLVAKLADKGERVKCLVNRIEQELLLRKSLDKATTQKTESDFGEKIEWNVAEEDVKAVLPEKASDPLLNYLQQQKSSKILDPYAENICSKFGSPKPPATGPDRFMPHRSTESSMNGHSKSMESAENHCTQEIPIRDSLLLQKEHIHSEATLPKANTQLATWRQMAAMIDSDDSDSDNGEDTGEEDAEAKTEEEEDTPELPDFEDINISGS